MHRSKDFIATAEKLIFAVVTDGNELGKVRCFLRYACVDGGWRKIHSGEANRFLADHFPQYLFHSILLDADLHGVPVSAISRHYLPLSGLQDLLNAPASDQVLVDLLLLCSLLQQQGVDLTKVGITGSLLLGFQHPESDIDLVCYEREVFQQLRMAVRTLLGSGLCRTLTDADWRETYLRRGCELTLAEYVAHEKRKFNKGMVNDRKFDLSLVNPLRPTEQRQFKKLGAVRIETTVIDDQYGFDYPAEFSIDHLHISSVVSFTATYNGQAQTGERILVAGQLEIDQDGCQRIVVGSSREAGGEYIKLLE
jgi:hypothetical protein